MNATVKGLEAEARKLSIQERADLIERILESLDTTSPELDRKWTDEAKDRLAAYRRGEIAANDFDEVLAKYDRP